MDINNRNWNQFGHNASLEFKISKDHVSPHPPHKNKWAFRSSTLIGHHLDGKKYGHFPQLSNHPYFAMNKEIHTIFFLFTPFVMLLKFLGKALGALHVDIAKIRFSLFVFSLMKRQDII